jgi:hypothetical protein
MEIKTYVLTMTYTKNVHSNFICSVSKLETFEKVNCLVYPYNETLLSNKKEQVTDIHNEMDKS